jgi:DNA-binding MarR family transcriptional regulator
VTAPAPEVGRDVTELLVALSRARRWLSRLATGEHSPVGASGVSALAEVVRSGPIRLGDLAAREGVAPATLSRVVAGLVEHGFVERSPDPEDARAGILTATPAGVAVLEESRRRRTAELVGRLERLTDEERDAVLDAAPALRRLVDEGPPSLPLLASSERCPGRGPFQPLTPAASPRGRRPGGR